MVNVCTSGDSDVDGAYERIPGKWHLLEHPPVDAQAYRDAARVATSQDEKWLGSDGGHLILCHTGYRSASMGAQCYHHVVEFDAGPPSNGPIRRLLGNICLTWREAYRGGAAPLRSLNLVVRRSPYRHEQGSRALSLV